MAPGAARGAAAMTRGHPPAVLLSYVVNELTDELRRDLLERLIDAAAAGTQVLVMEPVSRRTSPWWPAWVRAFLAAGGRHDEWRLPITPPPVTLALGRAAGLDAVSATGRTLWLGPPPLARRLERSESLRMKSVDVQDVYARPEPGPRRADCARRRGRAKQHCD